jgi:hypothetical protein
MMTMKRGGLAALVALALSAAPGAAQEMETECRCVDPDGNRIERCTCFQAPDVEGMIAQFRAMSSGTPRLGISIDPTQGAATDAEGALVLDVMEGGPAEEAGLRAGDVITAIDGASLVASTGAGNEADFDLDRSVPVQRLLALTQELEPGESVEVEYVRDDRQQTTTVDVEDLAGRWGQEVTVRAPEWDVDRFRAQMRGLADGARSYRLRVAPRSEMHFFGDSAPQVFSGGELYAGGLELAEVNPGLGEYFGTDEGVLVIEAGRGSRLGLEAGDVVLRIGSRSVTSPERFHRVLASYGDDEDIDFHILRDGSESVVTGRLRY